MDSGLSLKDDIKDGDLLFVDFNNKEVINNKTYVIQQGNNLRVKKLRKEFNGDLYLVSNNEKEYPVERVAEETTVIGRVMWNISMENV
jgi:phage repressor protein C with HTH and peptisase S24 domain